MSVDSAGVETFAGGRPSDMLAFLASHEHVGQLKRPVGIVGLARFSLPMTLEGMYQTWGLDDLLPLGFLSCGWL